MCCHRFTRDHFTLYQIKHTWGQSGFFTCLHNLRISTAFNASPAGVFGIFLGRCSATILIQTTTDCVPGNLHRNIFGNFQGDDRIRQSGNDAVKTAFGDNLLSFFQIVKKGLVHFGQGKWYPGEQLPRWSLNCFWRRDGEALWKDPALIADERRDYGADEQLAGRFLRQLAEQLAIDPKYVFAAYEDVYYYLWREDRLPVNVDPFDSRLDDALERDRLAKVFRQGLTQAVGHVVRLPQSKSTGTSCNSESELWHCLRKFRGTGIQRKSDGS